MGYGRVLFWGLSLLCSATKVTGQVLFSSDGVSVATSSVSPTKSSTAQTISSYTTVTPIDTSCQDTSHGRRTCEVFDGSFCLPILKAENRSVASRNCSEKFVSTDAVLQKLWHAMRSVYDADQECIEVAQWVLCLLVFPECDAEHALTRVPCREACTIVRDDLCKKEWYTIDRMKDILESDIVVPRCENFPPQSTSTCIFPQVITDVLDKRKQKDLHVKFIIIGSAGGTVLCLLMVAIGLACRLRHKRRTKKQTFRSVSLAEIREVHKTIEYNRYVSNDLDRGEANNPLYHRIDLLAEATGVKVFPRDKLTYIEDLGEGAFGKVVKCLAEGIVDHEVRTVTAVKFLKDTHESDSVGYFRKEIETLSFFNHPNVIKLLGICIEAKRPKCLILEFMKLGDLNKFLRDRSGTYHAVAGSNGQLPEGLQFLPPELSTRTLLSIAKQIAEGLGYLGSKRFVHRDIATRNCLVDEQLRVKIADFGLAHDVYGQDYYRVHSQKVLPLRWLSPEALTLGKFTVKSDIWAYGVTLWEVITYGVQPFYGKTNEEVCDRIRCHKLLERPYGCPARIYELMRSCWRFEPSHRKSCESIAETLGTWLAEREGGYIDESWQFLLHPPIQRKKAMLGRGRKTRYQYKRSEITI